jgi:protein-ribulosamine 3-kinase
MRALKELVPFVASIEAVQSVGGGCISDAKRVSIVDDTGNSRTLFVKSNDASFLDNFRCEWDGLVRLGQPNVIGVPVPIAVGVVDEQAYLVTGWIDQRQTGSDFFAQLGKHLADLHRATLGSQIGLDRDNYVGAARQVNSPTRTWSEFVAVNRIEFQLRWAIDQGLGDSKLQRDCRQIIRSIDKLLDGREESTSLLHGDLWSGNYLCESDGRPVIIDPAVYYGCREAEFGMLKLFGSCPESFYEAYTERFPLRNGWQRRTQVYVLYHLLNHLNLFGSGYHSQCRQVAAEILSH